MLNRLYHYFSSSIRNQLILGITLVHAIMMTIFIFDLVERQRDFLSNQGQSQAQALAKTLAINSTSWVIARDIIGIAEVLQSNSSYPDLEYAMVLTHLGEVLGHTDAALRGKYPADEISKQLFKSDPVPRVLVADQLMIDVAYPIQIDGELIGWARVGVNQEAVASGLNKITRNGLLYTLLAIAVGILFAYFMARGLTAGLKRLVHVAEETRSGRDDIRANLKRDDEVGVLANGLDLMLETQQQNKVALRESEDHYRTLIENIPGVTYRCLNDSNYTMEYISNEIEEMSGYKTALFTKNKMSYTSIIHKDDLQNVSKVIKAATTKKQPFSLEYRIVKANGELAFVFERGQQTEAGILEGVILDITEQKLASEALQQQQQENDLILDTMLDGVISIDKFGIIMSVNASVCEMFGYTDNTLLGTNVDQLMPETTTSKHAHYMANYIDTGYSKVMGLGREITGVRKDGSLFPMRITIAQLPTRKGEGERFIGVCHDITVEKEQEMQIRRSQKMDALGKLTGGVAHDYNNMLGVIMGYAELLQLKLENNPDLLGYVDEIYHAGERGAQLTKKLLSFSRQRQSETQTVNINTVLKNQKDMLAKTLTVRIKIVMDLDENLWSVKLESGELEDVILNLSINAMHAMNEGGTLTFKSSNMQIDDSDTNYLELHPGDYVALSISDTGTGMDEITQNRMFDPFFSTKGEQGTGLGLSQVYGFMQRNRGSIKVYSEQGHGTRILLYFPRDVITEGLPQTSEPKLEKEIKGSEIILVVDDEPALVTLASNILTSHGYQVLTANNAKEALIILNNEAVDLLLSDIIMPNMDGYQLASQVQQKFSQVKIILCSGFDDGRHVDEVDEKLQIQVIQKPYSSKSLLKQVREILDSNN